MIYSYNGILLSTKKDRTTDTYMIESLKYNFEQKEPDTEVSAGQGTEELGERAWSFQPTQWAT